MRLQNPIRKKLTEADTFRDHLFAHGMLDLENVGVGGNVVDQDSIVTILSEAAGLVLTQSRWYPAGQVEVAIAGALPGPGGKFVVEGPFIVRFPDDSSYEGIYEAEGRRTDDHFNVDYMSLQEPVGSA